MSQIWEVVGGADKGGILVRKGQALTSAQCEERLSTGALIEEITLVGDRLNYKLTEGSGPASGWVSLSLKGKALVQQKDDAVETPSGDASDSIDVEARCAAEWAKPQIGWDPVTMDNLEKHEKKVKGKIYGMDFPWSGDTLKQLGPQWMTKAFRAAGSIPAGARIKAITDVKKYVGGGACSKLFIDVEYASTSGTHTKLFAKIPFPMAPDTRSDRIAQSVMTFQSGELGEINVSRLLESRLPFRIPKYYFGDFSNETTNWILITERIPFNSFSKEKLEPFEIEPPYEKMMDWNLRGSPQEYYDLLMLVGGKMAGMYKAGQMGNASEIDKAFGNQSLIPKDAWGMREGSTGLGASEFQAKLKMGVEFLSVAKAIFDADLITPPAVETYKLILSTVNAYKQEILYYSNMDADYASLMHGNLNVDNSFWWRDENGKLDIGVLDLNNGVGSLGIKLWWSLYGCEPDFLVEHGDRLLELFIKVYQESGGPSLDLKKLKMHFILAAMDQGVGLLGAVPQIYRMCKKKTFEDIKSRRDPRIAENIDGKNTLRLYCGGFVMMMTLIKHWKVMDWVDEFVNEFSKASGLPKKTI